MPLGRNKKIPESASARRYSDRCLLRDCGRYLCRDRFDDRNMAHHFEPVVTKAARHAQYMEL
jgi:hypothetical protein